MPTTLPLYPPPQDLPSLFSRLLIQLEARQIKHRLHCQPPDGTFDNSTGTYPWAALIFHVTSIQSVIFKTATAPLNPTLSKELVLDLQNTLYEAEQELDLGKEGTDEESADRVQWGYVELWEQRLEKVTCALVEGQGRRRKVRGIWRFFSRKILEEVVRVPTRRPKAEQDLESKRVVSIEYQ